LVPREADALQVVIETDGSPEHRVYVLEDQNQIVLDVLHVKNPFKTLRPSTPHPLLERVRPFEIAMPASGGGPPSTLARLVFDLKKPVQYRVDVATDKLTVNLLPKDPGPVPLASRYEAERSTEIPSPARPAPATGPGPPSRIQPEDTDPSLFFGLPPPSSDRYPLGPEDVIEIRVFDLDQLNRTVRVSGDGKIDLPLVGPVAVLDLTPEQVAERVAAKLSDRYLKEPQVSVLIKEFNSRKVSVLGAVARPASYPLTGRRNLLQLLADAGGLTGNAGKNLYLFRQTPEGQSARLSVPLDELLVKGEARWNVWLYAGDVVSVPVEETIAVSVLGAVRTPGIHQIPTSDGATLTKAIARAGGLTDRASRSGISIKRRDPLTGREEVLKSDLGDILSGKKPDFLLQEGDVILVKESFF
jgi:polysaccharide export outer membrane protein